MEKKVKTLSGEATISDKTSKSAGKRSANNGNSSLKKIPQTLPARIRVTDEAEFARAIEQMYERRGKTA